MRRARETGYSLIELAVTVAVVAILAAVAFPNFRDVLRSNRVGTASNELVASLSLARVEALRSPRGAGMCASADGATCGDDWNAGWIVWSEAGDNEEPGGTNDLVLKYVQGRGNLSVTADAGDGTFFFDRRGRSGIEATITVAPADECPDGAELVRELHMTAAGQVHTARKECGS